MAITQNHVINIQPGVSAPLVIHCSQGDTGTQINLTVVNGDEEFDCSSYACSVHGVRSDGGNWGPITCTVSGSTVCFSLTSAMTAVAGACLAEISVGTVGTANFAMLMENATFGNGVTYSNDVSVYQNILNAVQAGLSLAEAAVTNEKSERVNADNSLSSRISQNDARIQAEKNERIAAVNAEATARQTADNTLQGNINSEVSTRATADSNLQSQINQIVAPSGEAPSAAEVQNARVGANGITYDTLGNAIRTQVQNLENESRDIIRGLTEVSGYVPIFFEQGSVNTNTGAISDNANYIRSNSVPVTPETQYTIYLTNNTGVVIGPAVVYYKADGTYLSSKTNLGNKPIGESVFTLTPPTNAYYLRFRYNKVSGDINPAEISQTIYDKSSLIDNALVNYGVISRTGLDLNTDDFVHPGMWAITDLAMIPYHYPSARRGRIISFASSSNNTIYTYQVVIDDANVTYRRFSTNTSVWSPWVCDNPYNKLAYKPSDPVCTFEATKHTQADTGNYTMIWGKFEDRVSRLIGMYDAEANPNGYSINKSSLGKDATNTFDVWLYKVSLGYTNQTNKPVVLLVVGEHGNEPASAMTGYYAYKEILNGALSKYLTYVDFWVVPIMNPYGYEHNIRNNGNDVNLNRDFPANWNYSTDSHNKTDNYSMSQPETNYIINLCLQNRNRILFVCNKHDTGAIGRKIAQNEVDTVGYLTTCLYTDSVINESICKFEDQQVKETDPYIITACSADLSHKQLIVNNSPHPLDGSLDLFLNAIGIHASLLEGSYGWNDGSNVYYDGDVYNNVNYATSQIRYITDFFVNYIAWTIQHSEYLQSSDRAFDAYTLKSRKYNESTGAWDDITLWYNGTSVVGVP